MRNTAFIANAQNSTPLDSRGEKILHKETRELLLKAIENGTKITNVAKAYLCSLGASWRITYNLSELGQIGSLNRSPPFYHSLRRVIFCIMKTPGWAGEFKEGYAYKS